MIRFLNEEESIVNVGEIKLTEKGYVVENLETRGTIKQCALDITKDDYFMLKYAIQMLGLEDYIRMEQDDNQTTYIRVIVEEEQNEDI